MGYFHPVHARCSYNFFVSKSLFMSKCLGVIPFLTGFQERILFKACLVLFREKIVQENKEGGKKSNCYILLGKFFDKCD